MALFAKKKGQKEEIIEQKEPKAASEGASAEGTDTNAQTEAGETQAPEEPKFKAVPASQFSQRIGGIFGRMYRMILSCDLEANVYQVESGEQRICDDPIPLRGYYENLMGLFYDCMIDSDKERFKRDFSRQGLSTALSGPNSGFSGVYCIEVSAEANGTSYGFYEFRADKISNIEVQGHVQQRIRAIIYIRQIKEPEIKRSVNEAVSANSREAAELNEVRITKLLGGNKAYFFEYDVIQDRLTLHSENAEGKITSVIPTYLKAIEVRSDWSIFHSDLSIVTDLFVNAIKGIPGSAEIRYRLSGEKKKTPYRMFKIQMAPQEYLPPVSKVIGALTDIDDEFRMREAKNEYGALVEKLLHAEDASLYEIDLDKNYIFQVLHTDDGYIKDPRPDVLSEFFAKRIEGGRIHYEDSKLYSDILRTGFLEKRTLGGTYSFESRIKPIGSDEFKWFSETFTRIGVSNKYLRMTKDVDEIHAQRTKEYEIAERERYMTYNQNMLDTMASLVEFRNVESGSHVTHVRKLTRILLEDIVNRSPMYDLTKHDVDMYSEAAIMHDIGKIVVPDYILNKAGKLTEEEFEIMKKHTTDGARIVKRLDLPGQEELMKYCYEVALHHHERFDGKGYPDGLVGDATPIGVQAVGLADVYDAIVSIRCYKSGLSHDDAVNMILRGECGAFNPRLLESFKMCKDRMYAEYSGDLSKERFDYSTLNNQISE